MPRFYLAFLFLASTGCPGAADGIDAGAMDAGFDAREMFDDVGPAPDAGDCVIRCGPAGICCGAAEECVFDACLPACAGSRCADETLCCDAAELCVGRACVTPGALCSDDAECGPMETCEPLVRRCIPLPPTAVCRYIPPSGVYDPEIQWAYELEQSLAIPLVMHVNDDGVPDVIALTYPATQTRARLTALSGDDGRVLWQSDPSIPICGGASPAAADLDGDGTIEIVVVLSSAGGTCGTGGAQDVAAFSHFGALEWRSDTPVSTRYTSIAIADLEGDGTPEVVAGGSVFSNVGVFRWAQPELNDMLGALGINAPSVADIDGDLRMEVIASNVAFNDDGTELWRAGTVVAGYTAIARLVETPSSAGPQVVAVNETTLEILDGADGATLFGPITYESMGTLAGPPTVADFDGDGRPEIGVAGEERFVVFDLDLPPPYVRWSVMSMDDTTGSVGSTVFDFDADGSAEVVYSDECHLRILSGDDGTLLFFASNTSQTASEYPVVADIDADGNAEMVVVSNAFGGLCDSRALDFTGVTQGVRVYRDRLDNWVPTRSIWNQHTYHLDNILDDGSVPILEARGWTTHNSYRQNRLQEPEAVTLAPDLVVVAHDGLVEGCPVTVTLRARVENRGSRGVAAGVNVAFYAGAAPDRSQLLGVASTTGLLLSGAGEWVTLDVAAPALDPGLVLRFYAVADDDGMGRGAHSECDETNNEGTAITFDCSGPI